MSDDEMTEDDLEALSEDDESDDESAGDDEFLPLPLPFNFGSSKGRGVRTPSNRSYAGSGMTMWVNRAEFNQALEKVRKDVATASSGIKQVNSRVSALATTVAKQNKAIVKQNKALVAQGKALVGLKKQFKKAQEDALLMTLLMRPKTIDATTERDAIGGSQVPVGARIAYEDSKGISPLLLMLMMSGDGFNSSNNMLPLLMLSGAL